MRAGSYTLHLYCDNEREYPDGTHDYQEFPHVYNSERGATCRRGARRAGWVLGKRDLCPKCSNRKRGEGENAEKA